MANIYPFKGYRYDENIVGDVNLVVTQPYDKISQELQQEYYRRSPYNVVRVTRSSEKNQDPDTEYREAGAILRSWIEEGVLVQDPTPAIYAYYRFYDIDDEEILQRGFIALLDLKHAGSAVLPHERTLTEPKMDRLRLLRRTECNEDALYMLYTDDKLVVNDILDDVTSKATPVIEARDDFGALHRVWAITNPAAVRKIQEGMFLEELFIADGHHRYDTAVNYLTECQEKGWQPVGIETFDKRLVTCFNSADSGTTILPTHRLVRNLEAFDSQLFLHRAAPSFAVERAGSAQELFERMKGGSKSHVFGFYSGDSRTHYLLTLKEVGLVDPLMLAHGEAYRHLDVSILHTLILNGILGIDEQKLAAQSHVDYRRDPKGSMELVDEGKYQAAFFLNPTTVEQMQRVALLRERMPQKSTDFYPKLLTGLVFMQMRIAKK